MSEVFEIITDIAPITLSTIVRNIKNHGFKAVTECTERNVTGEMEDTQWNETTTVEVEDAIEAETVADLIRQTVPSIKASVRSEIFKGYHYNKIYIHF